MSFTESIRTCLLRYASFDGCAGRPEFWWFTLFVWIVHAALHGVGADLTATVFWLGTLLPSLAVGTRRLHDTDRTGWWQLLWAVPVLGWIILIVMLAQEGKPNRFGVTPQAVPT